MNYQNVRSTQQRGIIMVYLIRSYNRNKDEYYVNELIEDPRVKIEGNNIIFTDFDDRIMAAFSLNNVFVKQVKIANKKKEKD